MKSWLDFVLPSRRILKRRLASTGPDWFERVNAAREIAEQDAAPADWLIPVLVEAIQTCEGWLWGNRIEAEYRLLRALARYAGRLRLERELPRLAGRLIELAGDWKADDDETPIRAVAADLLVQFRVADEWVPALGRVLNGEHRSLHAAERVIEALSRTGGETATGFIEREIERAREDPHPVWQPGQLKAAVERGTPSKPSRGGWRASSLSATRRGNMPDQ